MSKINTGDRRKKMRALRRRDGTSCHWCSVELDFRPLDGVEFVDDYRLVNDTSHVWKHEVGWLPTLDHYVTQKAGGSNKIKNLVLACDWCNQKRGHLTPNQFKKWLRKHGVPEEKRRKRKL